MARGTWAWGWASPPRRRTSSTWSCGQTPTGQATRRRGRARPACTSLRVGVQCSGSAVVKTCSSLTAAKPSGALGLEVSARDLGRRRSSRSWATVCARAGDATAR
eukprot:2671633-Pyramimonas_sp.AAC.1